MDRSPYPNIQPWELTPEDEQLYRQTDATMEWRQRLSGDELRPYAGKWVAAKDCQFIAAAETYEELLEKLADVDLRTVIVENLRKPTWTIYS